MLNVVIIVVLFLLSLSILGLFIRVVKGPTMHDRIVALDTIGINLIATIGVTMISQNSFAYADVILVIAILGFVGTISLAKFLDGGVVFDRDSD